MTNTSPKPLRDLMRFHTDPLVNPLCWTSRHLDFVGCRFGHADPANTESRSTPCDSKSNKSSPRDAELLATNPFPIIKHCHLTNILLATSLRSKGSQFFFADRPVHRPQYSVFYRHGHSDPQVYSNSPPLVGNLHYTSVVGDRGRQFEPFPDPHGGLNFLGSRILTKRMAQITPQEWTRDPYFVCLLLAIAQLQERRLGLSEPSTYTSRLLVTRISDREYIHLHEAKITTELLEALRDPASATTYTEWPVIWQRKLPFKPYDTFADRLVAELVQACSLWSHDSSELLDGECGTKQSNEDEDGRESKIRRK
ncbi:hypothetical protein BO71DRAFT_391186 [Aspergillus ellipticus CBS 707.79]|uniref:Uncharacterized protein n=1 Tax=Aspergillus ellipticus CBS 707.79 TaxID=1448320 RepID=A0A319CV50_9EURO|nr:hypothetical protein BO71DRAFT_391186 [Aspergillus ellipticus CBS 707.79]